MTDKTFSDHLRKYRKEKNLSVHQVASYLTEHVKPVSSKTVYGWETGASVPGSDILMKLCEIYDIPDVLSAFGYDIEHDDKEETTPMYFLTPKEWELVQAYRDNPEFKKIVKKLYDIE